MANTVRKVYWISGSGPAWRVLATLKEKKLDFVSKKLDASAGDLKSPEMLALNPRGQVPVLVDGDTIVCQSLAAMQYLDAAYDEVPLMPRGDSAALALALQRLHEASVLYETIQPIFGQSMFGKVNTEAEKSTFAAGIEKARKELAYFEDHVKDDPPFIAGDTFTLADVSLTVTVLFAIRGGATLAAYPHLLAFVSAMKERACFKDTFPPHWLESPNKDWLKEL